jgi:hypothetical protein
MERPQWNFAFDKIAAFYETCSRAKASGGKVDTVVSISYICSAGNWKLHKVQVDKT